MVEGIDIPDREPEDALSASDPQIISQVPDDGIDLSIGQALLTSVLAETPVAITIESIRGGSYPQISVAGVKRDDGVISRTVSVCRNGAKAVAVALRQPLTGPHPHLPVDAERNR